MAKIIFDSEKELEDYVCAKIEVDGFCPLTGKDVTLWARQVNLGSYGIADLIKLDIDHSQISITVTEFKKERIDISAIAQLSKYMTALRRLVKEFSEKYAFLNSIDIAVFGEIVAPDINQSDNTCYLLNEIDSIRYIQAFCDLDSGFSGKMSGIGWHKTEENFPDYDHVLRAIKKHVIVFARLYQATIREELKLRVVK